MQNVSDGITLTTSEAACLAALKSGLDSKARIAISAGLDLKSAAAVLDALGHARLAARKGRYYWRATKLGQSCVISVIPDPERRKGGKTYGKIIPGSTAERMLDALDRPMRGAELVELLGVTPQRVHQLVVKHIALGRLRVGDERSITYIVARREDPSVLLARDEERVLSALPDDTSTNAPRLSAAARLPAARTKEALARLCEKGFIAKDGSVRGRTLYVLGPEGRSHFQRRSAARRAGPLPLKVKSDRVLGVLSYLAEQGETRIRDVRDALGVSRISMNALFQYLKRRGLVKKVARDLNAPYALTTEGSDTLAELTRRGQ